MPNQPSKLQAKRIHFLGWIILDTVTEALKTLEPALAHYLDAQVQGATHLNFRQYFPLALCVQAPTQPGDTAGTSRRDALEQAARLLSDLSNEARQLHYFKELLSRIAAARGMLNQNAWQS